MSDNYYSDVIDIANSTVLITGGASGIGFGLTKCFLRSGASVIIIDRHENKLEDAVKEIKSEFDHSKIHSHLTDIEHAEQREELFKFVKDKYPETNIIVNNAGIQQRQPLIQHSVKKTPWNEREKEIQINLCAPIHLSNLFLEYFVSISPRKAAIINVTSDLAFVPLALLPIYSATKAALHSFTMSLRLHLLNDAPSLHVYEIVPPPVRTNLGGSHPFGETVEEFCEAIFEQFVKGKQEIGYKQSERIRQLVSRDEIDEESRKLYAFAKSIDFSN